MFNYIVSLVFDFCGSVTKYKTEKNNNNKLKKKFIYIETLLVLK